MPAPKPSSGRSRSASGSHPATRSTASKRSSQAKERRAPNAERPPAKTDRRSSKSGAGGGAGTGAEDGAGDGLTGLAEQLLDRIVKPLGLVLLTSERIQEILDDAAARGRVTRSDANDLAAELVNRGRQQTDQLLTDADRLVRQQLSSATIRARRSESLDLLMRSADRARRSVGASEAFPILGYDELTAAQVQARLTGLSPAERRKVRDYERRHANRKSVLSAVDKELG